MKYIQFNAATNASDISRLNNYDEVLTRNVRNSAFNAFEATLRSISSLFT